MKIVSFSVRKKSAAKPAPKLTVKEKTKNPILKSIKTFFKPKKRRKILVLTLCVLTLVALFPLSGPGRAVVAAATKRDLPIYCVEKDSKVCSLTFDAAWGNEDTQHLIEILGKYNIKATFFVVGEWVDKYPESVQALFDAGHEIMNHSSDHKKFTKLSSQEIIDDINLCNDKIEAVTGERPTLFRPPYGDYNDNVVASARSANVDTIMWDVDSLDWKDLSAKDISKRVLGRVKPGSIILFHNAAKNTPEALPEIIECLIQKGYGFLPVSQLIMKEDYQIDHTGMQCPLAK